MKATITLEELAIKLNGKFWSKGQKERVYIKRGFATKKMSADTYIEIADDEFIVNCFIDCPSQSITWIASQQEKVINDVEQEILAALTNEYYYVLNNENKILNSCCLPVSLSDLTIGDGIFLHEGLAKRFIRIEEIENGKVEMISRENFEKLKTSAVEISEEV